MRERWNLGASAMAIAGTALCAGCFAGTDEGASAPRLEGDWFPCTSEDCSEIGDDGTRFRGDGTVAGLDTEGGPVGEAPICVTVDGEQGHFSLALTGDDRGVLMLGMGDQTREMSVVVGTDVMIVFDVQGMVSHGEPSPPEDIRMIRLPTVERATCPRSGEAPRVPMP